MENEENCLELVQKAGRHMKVNILTKEAEKREKHETILTHADMLKVKASMGISGRSTINLAKDLRLACKNRKVVQPGMKRHLKEHVHKLDSTFTVQKLGGTDIPAVYCNDIKECLEIVQEERGIHIENTQLKIGLDAGGGFFKVCLNILTDEEALPENDFVLKMGFLQKKV